jgi:hypothetical protein
MPPNCNCKTASSIAIGSFAIAVLGAKLHLVPVEFRTGRRITSLNRISLPSRPSAQSRAVKRNRKGFEQKVAKIAKKEAWQRVLAQDVWAFSRFALFAIFCSIRFRNDCRRPFISFCAKPGRERPVRAGKTGKQFLGRSLEHKCDRSPNYRHAAIAWHCSIAAGQWRSSRFSGAAFCTAPRFLLL